MAFAFSAARASGALSRRVGAAIVDQDGHIVSTGCNDVPRFGGGVYESDIEGAQTDSQFLFRKDVFRILDSDVQGGDSNDFVKFEVLDDQAPRDRWNASTTHATGSSRHCASDRDEQVMPASYSADAGLDVLDLDHSFSIRERKVSSR